MSILDDVFDLEASITEEFGKESDEFELFDRITTVMFMWEDELDKANKKLQIIEDFKQLLKDE